MGRRDFRHREPKKLKKDAKKVSAATVLTPPETVEVVKKKRKKTGSSPPSWVDTTLLPHQAPPQDKVMNGD